MTIKKRHLASIIAFMVISALVFAGCNGETNTTPANADQTGTIILSVNPEIMIEYDKDGTVTSLSGSNEDGKAILNDYTFTEGASCTDVVNELITLIYEAGYIVDDIDSEKRTVVIQMENGSYIPFEGFMEGLRTGAKNTADTLDVKPDFVTIDTDDYDSKYKTDSAPSPYITPEKAMELALSHSGVLSEDARFVEREYDIDDGTPVYELEFYANGYEFDCDIHAETGRVVDFSKEREKSANSSSASDAGNATTAKDFISSDEAKKIALDHAGVSASSARFEDREFDLDDGTPYYELEFYADGYEYEYEIHAVSGKVIDYDKDRDEDYNKNNTAQNKPESSTQSNNAQTNNSQSNNKPQTNNNNTSSYIGISRAKEIALSHAGVSAADARFDDREFDLDDGTPYYELEFKAKGYKYEYDIHAVSGKVVDSERERIDDDDRTNQNSNAQNNNSQNNNSQNNSQSNTTSYIGLDKAKEVALSHAGVSASSARFEKGEFDNDDGTPIYELEFKANGYEYEYNIHAVSGKVLDSERDKADD